MSEMTSIEKEKELLEFVEKAKRCFETLQSPPFVSFTMTGEIICDELFALRWGMGDDCILVFRVSHEMEPRVYQQAIKRS